MNTHYNYCNLHTFPLKSGDPIKMSIYAQLYFPSFPAICTRVARKEMCHVMKSFKSYEPKPMGKEFKRTEPTLLHATSPSGHMTYCRLHFSAHATHRIRVTDDIRIKLPDQWLKGELELCAIRREPELARHAERANKTGVQDELIYALCRQRHHALGHYLLQKEFSHSVLFGPAGKICQMGNFKDYQQMKP